MDKSFHLEKINDLLGHNGAIYSLVHHPGSPWFYSVAGDGWIVRWDASGEQKDGLLIADAGAKLFSALISHSGKIIVAGDMNGYIYWIDLDQNLILTKSLAHQNSVFDLCLIDNDQLVSVSGDGFMCVWDLASRKATLSIKISTQGLRCLTYDAKNAQVIIGASDNNIYFVGCHDWKVKHTIVSAHQNSVFSLAIIEEMLLSGGRDAHLKGRNIHDDTLIFDMPAHWYTINKIKHIPSLNLLATASRDKTFRLWDHSNFEAIKVIDVQKGGHHHSVNTLLWIPENNILASAGDDRVIKMWKIISS